MPPLLLPGLVGGASGKGCWRKWHPALFTLPVSHQLQILPVLAALEHRGSVLALLAVSLPVGGSPGSRGGVQPMTPSEQLKAQRLACPTLVLTQHRRPVQTGTL